MTNIRPSDLVNVSPVYDLARAEELEQLDELAPVSIGASSIDEMELTAVTHMLGLNEAPPAAAALEAPPRGDLSLLSMTGPQIRGAFRRMVVNFRFNAE